jgi:hypothetical protein
MNQWRASFFRYLTFGAAFLLAERWPRLLGQVFRFLK